MKTIIVSKLGMTFKPKTSRDNQRSLGEASGTTDGLMRHLVECGFNVVYFGRYVGDPIEGITVVQPDLSGLDCYCLMGDQKERFAENIRQLEELPNFDPLCFIDVCGPTSSSSLIDNPRCAGVPTYAIKYIAPQLSIMQHFKLPRICVNNDVRNYPRNHEMSQGWEHVRPAAFLDQIAIEKPMTIGFKKHIRKSVWGKPEGWMRMLPVEGVERSVPAVVIAHAHIATGYKHKRRADAFDDILFPLADLAELYHKGLRIYGDGWEHYPLQTSMTDLFAGLITPNEVMTELARARCCPCVAPGPGFITNKPHICIAQGCIPLLYGDGNHPLTFDPTGLLLKLNHHTRVVIPGDLARTAKQLENNDLYEMALDYWRTICQPDFSIIDGCLTDLQAGLAIDSDTWWDRYGGYRRI